MPSPQERHPAIYCFDDVVIERDNFRVLKRDQARTLEPRAFDLLIYLVEHRGRVVEKGELFEQVWKQSFVTDSALTQEIRQIRRAIGDDADAPQYIETIQLSEQLKEKYINPSGIALLYVHAAEKDQAITWLERACEERDLNIHAIGTEPDWESLHAEPRFRNLLKRLGRPLIVPQSRQ